MSAWVIISTRCGQKEIVELLIVKGADVNAKGTVRTKVGGVTPLHIAA
ncbi:MAG: ankyrin repeat domain-containing protein, partial [Verrucomicrobia bacterium]|nr:ankyrin repeat domain-containing protein [Verrucomicrobiota bacterium]